MPSAIAFAKSSLYLPFRLLERPPEVSDPDRSLEAREGGLDPERDVAALSLLSRPRAVLNEWVTGGGCCLLSLLWVRGPVLMFGGTRSPLGARWRGF